MSDDDISVSEDASDEQLRAEFAEFFPTENASTQALNELRPSLLQARRKGQARTALAGSTAVMLLVLVGYLALLGGTTDTRLETGPAEVADGTTSTTPSDSVSTSQAGEREPDEPLVVSTSETPETSASATTAPQTTLPQTSDSQQTSDSASSPSTTAPSFGGATSMVHATIWPRFTLESLCGSITLATSGNTLRLDGVDPADGARWDLKNEGDKIEVSFEGSGDHCELEAELEDGLLSTSVDNENENDS